MKSSDRTILLGLAIVGLLAAFWFMLLAPKRERASELDQRVTELQTEVVAQEQLAVTAEQAQSDYAKNYERLVVLGKAAPPGGDTPSLLAQLSAHAEKSGTKFGSLAGGGDAPAAPPPPASETTTDQNEAAATAASETASTTPAVPTEAAAALLPIGATVGPAGLGVMPYTLQFTGDFFQVADLLARLDGQIAGHGPNTQVNGRLLTVNGFSMTPVEDTRDLAVDLTIATYVLPASQGLTAGATPTVPPTSIPPATSVTTSTAPTP